MLEEGRRLSGDLRAVEGKIEVQCEAPGSAVVWGFLGFTVQRQRRLGFVDPAAHSIVWSFFNTDFFQRCPLEGWFRVGIKRQSDTWMPKSHPAFPTPTREIKFKI